MLAKCRHNVADVSQRVSSTISQAFWTVAYFFYFLVKGNPNWKCERYSVETLKNCCVEARKTEQAHSKAASQKANQPSSTFRPGEANGFPKKRIWSRISEWFRKIKDVVVLYTRRVGRLLYDIACKVARFLRTVAQYLWAVIRAIFWPNVKSKPLPRSAPKPFSAKAQESPSFNKVQFLPEESLEKQELQPEQTAMPPSMAPEPEPVRRRQPTPAERLQMYTSEQASLQQNATPVAMPRQTTYAAEQPLQHEEAPGPSTYRFTDTSLDATHRETSPNVEENPMNAPPPAPPPPPHRPIRIDTMNGREDATMDPWEYVPQQSATTKKEPPGIGKLPADVMAELHGTQKMRLEREASVQREMTQSCHPDMTQWKMQENESRYDRSATATPYRASSVGPTMRKLEQVVSRLDDANENEAQYVFRAKPSDYMMGKSVFTPLEEAERIRDTINRSSRPVTPAHSVVSGRMTPYGQESYASHSYKRSV